MSIYELAATSIQKVKQTTFAEKGIFEKIDLQRLLCDAIDVIAEDCMVIAEEFGNWEDSKRRIDLLCIDREANLVVVELKRTEDGGHMDLQAIRYAAMSRQQRSKLLWLRMASFCRTEVALKTRSSRF